MLWRRGESRRRRRIDPCTTHITLLVFARGFCATNRNRLPQIESSGHRAIEPFGRSYAPRENDSMARWLNLSMRGNRPQQSLGLRRQPRCVAAFNSCFGGRDSGVSLPRPVPKYGGGRDRDLESVSTNCRLSCGDVRRSDTEIPASPRPRVSASVT